MQMKSKDQILSVEWMPIDSIRPYEGNPRVIPASAVTKVATSIREFGWRQPIVVDKSGVIIVGHTRRLAAIELKLMTVPVHVAKDMSAKQARAYRLADNRVGEDTRWDIDALAGELKSLESLSIDLKTLGFEVIELPSDVHTVIEVAPETVLPLDEVSSRVCPHCGKALPQ
jgi:ParB-like chromosome segregation protein Spo0J